MAVTYTRTIWENDKTPLNALNMNKIESGIEELTGKVNEFSFDANSAMTAIKNELESDIKTNSDEITNIKSTLGSIKELKFQVKLSSGRLVLKYE